MATNTNTEIIDVKTKADLSGLEKFRRGVTDVSKSTQDLSKDSKNLKSDVEGIFSGLAIAGIGAFISKTIKAGAELKVLSDNFEGTAKDIELFKAATAGTVSDGDLIKLSNQASDLGVSLQDQALLFSLAEDAADKYGGGVEENFNRVIAATDGSAKGLRAVGVSVKSFNEELKNLTESQGLVLDNMTADEQLNTRLQVIYKLTGITIDDVKNKQKDFADQIESVNVSLTDFIDNLGVGMVNTLVDYINIIKDVADATGFFNSKLLTLKDIAQFTGKLLIQSPIITFFQILKSEVQFAIGKINELTGLKLFQDSARGSSFAGFTQSGEGEIQFDKLGNPIYPSDYYAEQGIRKLKPKQSGTSKGSSQVKEKVEKLAIELILEAVQNVGKDYNVKNFIQDNIKIGTDVAQPYNNFGIENVNKLLGGSNITPYDTGLSMQETYDKSKEIFDNVQSLFGLLNAGTDTFIGKMLGFFSTINSILQAFSLVKSIIGIIGTFASGGAALPAGRLSSGNIYLGLDLNTMQVYKQGRQQFLQRQNQIRVS